MTSNIDILEIKLGIGLIAIANPDCGGKLLLDTFKLSQVMEQEAGWVLPYVRIRDDNSLGDYDYAIFVRNKKKAEGVVYPDKFAVYISDIDENIIEELQAPLWGIDYNDKPVFWVCEEDRSKFSCLTKESNKLIIEHLKEVCIQNFEDTVSPNKAEHYISRAILCYSFGDYKKTIEDCTKAIDMRPNEPTQYKYRAEAYYAIEKYKEALEDFYQILEFDPNNHYYYSRIAETLLHLKLHEEAVEYCNKAIAVEPNDARYFYLRGTVYRELENYQEALKDYTKILSLNPTYLEAYYWRSYINNCLGNYQEAIDDCNSGLEIECNNPHFYFQRAYAEYGFLQHKAAIVDCNKAIELLPDFPDAYCLLGDILAKQGQYPQAINNYNIAIEMYPYCANYYSSRAFVKCELEDYQEGIGDLQKALELSSDNTEYYYNLACLFIYFMGNYDKGLSYLNKVVEMQPNKAEGHRYRAVESVLHDRTDAALVDLDKAMELAPNDLGTYLCVGCIYVKLQRYDEAIKYLNQGIKMLKSYDVSAFFNRGVAHFELGNIETGLSDFKTILVNGWLTNFEIRRILQRNIHLDKLIIVCDKVLKEQPNNENAHRLKQAIQNFQT